MSNCGEQPLHHRASWPGHCQPLQNRRCVWPRRCAPSPMHPRGHRNVWLCLTARGAGTQREHPRKAHRAGAHFPSYPMAVTVRPTTGRSGDLVILWQAPSTDLSSLDTGVVTLRCGSRASSTKRCEASAEVGVCLRSRSRGAGVAAETVCRPKGLRGGGSLRENAWRRPHHDFGPPLDTRVVPLSPDGSKLCQNLGRPYRSRGRETTQVIDPRPIPVQVPLGGSPQI